MYNCTPILLQSTHMCKFSTKFLNKIQIFTLAIRYFANLMRLYSEWMDVWYGAFWFAYMKKGTNSMKFCVFLGLLYTKYRWNIMIHGTEHIEKCIERAYKGYEGYFNMNIMVIVYCPLYCVSNIATMGSNKLNCIRYLVQVNDAFSLDFQRGKLAKFARGSNQNSSQPYTHINV